MGFVLSRRVVVAGFIPAVAIGTPIVGWMWWMNARADGVVSLIALIFWLSLAFSFVVLPVFAGSGSGVVSLSVNSRVDGSLRPSSCGCSFFSGRRALNRVMDPISAATASWISSLSFC